MSIAIPGRRQAIAKITGKCPAQSFHGKQLSRRVSSIYTALEHGASDFFGLDFAKVQRHARNAHIYLAKLPGDVLSTVRTFLSGVQWKILAVYPDTLEDIWPVGGKPDRTSDLHFHGHPAKERDECVAPLGESQEGDRRVNEMARTRTPTASLHFARHLDTNATGAERCRGL